MKFIYSLNVKKIVLFICTIIIIHGCSEFASENLEEKNLKAIIDSTQVKQLNEFKFLNKKYQIPAGLTKWQAQLDKTIENNHLLMKNNLKLLSYTFVRNVVSVADLELVKHELNADNNFFVVLNDDSITNFTIGENEIVSKNYMKFLDLLLLTSDSIISAAHNNKYSSDESVYIFEKNDMGIVALNWQYKGEILNTSCLVSKRKGLLFDKILTCIPFEIQFEEKSIVSNQNNLKSSSTPPPPPDGAMGSSKNYNNKRIVHNSINKILWHYDITATLHGQCVDGRKVAISPEGRAYAYGLDSDDIWHLIFGTWDCKADIRTLDFKQGPEGYYLYAYYWAYKHNGVFTFEWNGTSYVTHGGGTSGGGTDCITADELRYVN
jgi:hypothetical protein